MTTGMAILVLTAFLASAVEAVEALTVVLAVGITRGWRSSLIGAGTATLALAGVIAALGLALSLMPIDILRVIVGTLLLVFGLQWLRKAILRFWYDFMVGDDWMIAAGVLMALVLSAAFARRGLNAWWVMLVTVVVLLAASLRRETRRSRSRSSA
jgi:uncharacterized membrane protein